MDLNLHLLIIDVLLSFVDVEDSRFVSFIELVEQEVRDESRLSHRGVTDKHELETL